MMLYWSWWLNKSLAVSWEARYTKPIWVAPRGVHAKTCGEIGELNLGTMIRRYCNIKTTLGI